MNQSSRATGQGGAHNPSTTSNGTDMNRLPSPAQDPHDRPSLLLSSSLKTGSWETIRIVTATDTFHVHKTLLARASHLFRAEFFSFSSPPAPVTITPNALTYNTVKFPTYSAHAVRAMVEFLYTFDYTCSRPNDFVETQILFHIEVCKFAAECALVGLEEHAAWRFEQLLERYWESLPLGVQLKVIDAVYPNPIHSPLSGSQTDENSTAGESESADEGFDGGDDSDKSPPGKGPDEFELALRPRNALRQMYSDVMAVAKEEARSPGGERFHQRFCGPKEDHGYALATYVKLRMKLLLDEGEFFGDERGFLVYWVRKVNDIVHGRCKDALEFSAQPSRRKRCAQVSHPSGGTGIAEAKAAGKKRSLDESMDGYEPEDESGPASAPKKKPKTTTIARKASQQTPKNVQKSEGTTRIVQETDIEQLAAPDKGKKLEVSKSGETQKINGKARATLRKSTRSRPRSKKTAKPLMKEKFTEAEAASLASSDL